MPLVIVVNNKCEATQVWYADDSSSCGSLDDIKQWWEELYKIGPDFGYYPNAKKTVLIVKEITDLPRAKMIFAPLGITVTCSGQRHLGAVVGNKAFKEEYVTNKVNNWVKDIEELANIAKEDPQIAYAGYTKGLCHRWKYVQRTIPDIEKLMEPLEDAISNELIPAIVGRKVSPTEREILSLPVRYGGLGIHNPATTSAREYHCSRAITEPLVTQICKQEMSVSNLDRYKIGEIKLCKRTEKEAELKKKLMEINSKVDPGTKRSIEEAMEKGASAWLTVLPLQLTGYLLNKQEFRDSIALRYGWKIQNIPAYCGCGHKNNINHTLDCKKGGYVSMRHNAIRDTEANLLREVCRDVVIEPQLLPVDSTKYATRTNTQHGARLDISARGVWSTFERTFFDVRVTHPNCVSNVHKPLANIYNEHEKQKKVEYEERVLQSEKGSFTPLIYTTSGGMGPQCTIFHKRLAEKIAIKRKERYAHVMNYIRTRLRFALLRSILVAIRGERGRINNKNENINDISFNIIPQEMSYEIP